MKSKPAKRTKAKPRAEVRYPPDSFVWGGEKIGQLIGRTEPQVWYLARKRHIDCDRIGRLIRSTPRRLGLVRGA